MTHFDGLSPDIHARLAARGIDPERSCEAWLAAIRDGSWPLERLSQTSTGRPKISEQTRRRMSDAATHHSWGERLVPLPIPLALVIPNVSRLR